MKGIGITEIRTEILTIKAEIIVAEEIGKKEMEEISEEIEKEGSGETTGMEMIDEIIEMEITEGGINREEDIKAIGMEEISIVKIEMETILEEIEEVIEVEIIMLKKKKKLKSSKKRRISRWFL